MRVLHILDHSAPLHSGYTFRTLSILKEQRALGWETYHLTSPKQGSSASDEETIDGWHFFRTLPVKGLVTELPGLGEIEMMGELTHRIEQVVRRIKPHILHAHSPVLNAIPALRVGRRLGLPVVYEVRAFWEDAAVDHGTACERGLRYRLTRALETYALKRCDAVTTICEGLRNDMVARGIPAAKITVVPNAVDVEQFGTGAMPDQDLRRQLGLEDKVVLGFIGSFYAYEGLALLVQALPALVRKLPNVRLLLVGGGAQEAELRRLAAESGVAERVIFVGRVPHADVPRYYDIVDILVYPRLPMRLTDLVTPLKPLEAMARGQIVLASDVGGHRELLRDRETALLFKAGDAEDLVEKTMRLVGERDGWLQMRAAARRYVETERTWRVSVAKYQDVYGPLLARMAA